MVATALKEKALSYFTMLDDERAQKVINYIEEMEPILRENKKHNLSDLKGKIEFSEGYDYKAMRSTK